MSNDRSKLELVTLEEMNKRGADYQDSSEAPFQALIDAEDAEMLRIVQDPQVLRAILGVLQAHWKAIGFLFKVAKSLTALRDRIGLVANDAIPKLEALLGKAQERKKRRQSTTRRRRARGKKARKSG